MDLTEIGLIQAMKRWAGEVTPYPVRHREHLECEAQDHRRLHLAIPTASLVAETALPLALRIGTICLADLATGIAKFLRA